MLERALQSPDAWLLVTMVGLFTLAIVMIRNNLR